MQGRNKMVINAVSVDECTDMAMAILLGGDIDKCVSPKKVSSKANKGVKAIAGVTAMAIATVAALPMNVQAANETHVNANTTSKTVYTRDYLRARLEPSLDGDVAQVLEPDTAVKLVMADDEWSLVEINDNTYWMASNYLTAEEVNYVGDVDVYDTDISVINTDVTDGIEVENGVAKYDTYDDTVTYNDTDDETYTCSCSYDALVSPSELEYMGVIEYGEYRYTWYSEQVLPGGGLDIPGRHVDEDGYICDENDYICLASDTLCKGTVVYTPLGKDGKVYDCGPGADDILDVYVSW